jgi:hypothetical protein
MNRVDAQRLLVLRKGDYTQLLCVPRRVQGDCRFARFDFHQVANDIVIANLPTGVFAAAYLGSKAAFVESEVETLPAGSA